MTKIKESVEKVRTRAGWKPGHGRVRVGKSEDPWGRNEFERISGVEN